MHRNVLRLVIAAGLAGGGPSMAQGVPSSLAETAQGSQQKSPFQGTWVANLAKSKRRPNHQFQSATLQFAVVGETVTLTHGGVNAGGQQESGSVVLRADGQEHPLPEQPGVVVATKWSGPRRLQTVTKSAGVTVGESSYEVSADGKTLTVTAWGTGASGARIDQVIVFDRQ